MTDELPPAVEVATDCYEAEFYGIEASAAVIETDRQAVRAAVVAEICEWLRDSNNTVRVMEKWHDRKQDGTLTDKTRENIGVAYIALKDASDLIAQRFGGHLK